MPNRKDYRGTVCFVVKEGKVLMAQIQMPNGQIHWNGLGGVIDAGETPAQAVVREFQEESELVVKEQDLREEEVVMIGDMPLHVYTVSVYTGREVSREESIKEFKWFDIESVPYDEMHEGNDQWLPKILNKYV